MKSRLVKHLSINATQLVVNQVFGFGIFYVLSIGLNKYEFGQINLVLAILLVVFNILSCGIDQLIIKKIAAGVEISAILSIYLLHILLTGLAFYGILLVGYYVVPSGNFTYSLLLLLGIGKLTIYFAAPFKQVANGLERFKVLAYMSTGSNMVRCTGLIALFLFHYLNLSRVIIIFISGDLTELLCCVLLYKLYIKTTWRIKWDRKGYAGLLRESLPQTGVVLITSALARFDWIFIGFALSAIKLAEYSFAYKIFEIATLPLLAIAPILIPRFTKLFRQTDFKADELKLLIRAEMIVAALVALILNMCWVPVIDEITQGKYGSVNIKTIFILTLCMPFLYVNNFLWTIFFAQGRLKAILICFIITLVVNVGSDVLLIPVFKNEGAAFAFLMACAVQTVYYIKKNDVANLTNLWVPLLLCVAAAFFSGFAAKLLFTDYRLALPVAVTGYVILLFATAQLKFSDRRLIAALFN